MTEIRADLIFTGTDIAELVGEHLNEKLYDYAFRADIAQVIAGSDQLCSDVLENMDYSDIIEGVTENIRFNHMDEVAESMVEDFTNRLIENTAFMESMHEVIENRLDETIMNRVNELAKRLANAERSIVELQSKLSSSKKAFWRGWL
jgi:uncharacterized SAM-dependent methyltransferase